MNIAGVLREISEADDEAIVAEGLAVYIGTRRSSWRVINALLRCGALSDRSETGDTFRRYVINESGRSIIRRPELAGELRDAYLRSDGPFMIQDDRIVALSASEHTQDGG